MKSRSEQPLPIALDLRARPRELPDAPPAIADFARPLRPFAPPRDDLDHDRLLLHSAALADGALMLPAAARPRLIPLFDLATAAPIPTPDPEAAAPRPAPLPLDDWALQPAVRGHIALDWPSASAGARRLAVAAVTLPFFAGPAAHAAEPAPAVQRPTAAPAVAPAIAPAARAEPEDMPQEAAEPPPPSPTSAPPPPAPSDGLVRGEGSIPAVFWQAMKGQEVVLLLASGRRPGRLVAVDADSILFVDYLDDGKLRVVPKDRVLELRGAIGTAGRPALTADLAGVPTGNARLGWGIAMTVAGSPLLLTGVVIGLIAPSATSITLPTFLPGAILLGAGIPLIVSGTRQRRAYQRRLLGLARLTPGFSATRRGWSGGLTLRF